MRKAVGSFESILRHNNVYLKIQFNKMFNILFIVETGFYTHDSREQYAEIVGISVITFPIQYEFVGIFYDKIPIEYFIKLA